MLHLVCKLLRSKTTDSRLGFHAAITYAPGDFEEAQFKFSDLLKQEYTLNIFIMYSWLKDSLNKEVHTHVHNQSLNIVI